MDLMPVSDQRGIFTRIFCKRDFAAIGHSKEFVQVNHSLNLTQGTVRGLHFQYPPKAEIKLIRCIAGSVFDVIVDLRKGSPTFLKWFGTVISEKNFKMIYVPEGFAHGFQTLEDNSELLYFHTEFYSPESEGGFNPLDETIGVKWPREITLTSEREKTLPFINTNFKGL